MGKFTIKELLDLNSGQSKLRLNDLFFISEEIIDIRRMNLIAEGMSSEGFGFEIRGIAIAGKLGGCVDLQQRVAVKRSRGIDGHEKIGEVGSWPKRKRTLESYNKAVVAIEGKWGCVNSKQQRVAAKLSCGGGDVTGDADEIGEKGPWLKRKRSLEPCKLAQRDSENLSRRAEKGRVLGRREANFEVEIRVAEKVRDQPISQLPNKICEGVVDLANKEIGTGSFANNSHPKASTTSNVDSEDSTRKALRAEMIKARFADTIRKAQEQKKISQGNKAEKESLGRRMANKEAEIRASKTMLQPKTSKICEGVVELANKQSGTGSLLSDTEPKVFTASNVDSENSTRKALHVETVKSRFTKTILKAQEKKLHGQGSKVEKKTMERRKASTEAEIRASECKLKEQRQKEREAARKALENMRRTVEWNHALEVTQEFEKFGVQCCVDRTPFARDRFHW